MPTKASMLTRVFIALFLIPACSSSDGGTPGTGGSKGTGGSTPGSGGSSAGSGGTPGTGGAVGTGGDLAGTGGSSPGTGGVSAGTGGSGPPSSGGQGGAAQGSGGRGGAGTGGAGGSVTGPTGGAPHVTPSMATSVPAMYGNAVANGGKMDTHVMYPVYYFATNFGSPLPPPNVPKLGTPMMKSCNVYTPPGYDKGTQYPLIVIMHGITDNPDTWIERSNPKIATLFDNLITMKATKPFVAVFASGTINNNQNGYYSFGAELVNDLVPFIEANYSVIKDRGSRAMAGFSFGGMQTLSTGLCSHLKEFAWFAGLDAAGPGTPSANDIAKYVDMQNPQMYPLYYLYIGVGANDGVAKGSSSSAANGLATKGPNITSANFSYQSNITGPGNGAHVYPTAEIALYNFLLMAFAPN